MAKEAFQDNYPDDLSYCYGCGRLNEDGLQIKSYWDGDETVAQYTPRPSHIAIPGYVYGGLIASLIDCHSTGTASAACELSPTDTSWRTLRNSRKGDGDQGAQSYRRVNPFC